VCANQFISITECLLVPLFYSGPGSQYFSVEINHGGFFVGTGSNRSYVDGGKTHYDNLDTKTWSPAMVENVVEEIGYEMQGRIKVHYLIPILTMQRNGLREIRTDADTQMMTTFVEIGHHFLKLYLDHDDSMRAVNWDDIIDFPVADLPPVMSPAKPIRTIDAEDNGGEVEDAHVPMCVVSPEAEGVRTRSQSSKVNEPEEQDVHTGGSDDEQDADFGLQDSDYEISDGDDDLYADHVDEDEDKLKKPTVQCKQKVEGDGESESDDLWAPDSDEDKVKIRFKTFREEDLKNPIFKAGQMFENVEMLRRAIREYSCLQRRQIKMPINDKRRLCARCAEGCSWYLWASYDSRHEAWMIKKYDDKHTCSRKFRVKAFTANFVAQKYLECFRADQDMNLKNFSRVVQKDWNMTPGRSKMQRARRIAMRIIYGDEEEQ
jgi:hypothetical protein